MLLRTSIWLQREGDVWAVSSNGGSSFTNVMNTIFFIHCKRHIQTHIPPLYSPPYILFLSVAGEDVRAGTKVYIVGLVTICNVVHSIVSDNVSALNVFISSWSQNKK